MRERVRLPGSRLLGLPFALVALLLSMVLAFVQAAAQSPPKIFRLGHLAAPGRTPVGSPGTELEFAL